ncbi:MAG: hypothetical protein HON70_04505, partial [Lentisphaerae bacterium]|nr:hypothetical protein [Lentisphaerota bacterium]
MIVEVKTDCRRSQARRCFSKTTLVLHGSETCEADLGLDVKQLVYSLGRPAPVELDLLFVSACAYGVDRLVPRSDTEDNWTRQFDVEIPVHELDRWQNVSSSLNTCLSFLT